MSRIYWVWRRLTGPIRQCWIEDGYCLEHHKSEPL